MKRFINLTLLVVLAANVYFTYRTVRFAKASEQYFAFLKMKTDCLEQKQGNDQNDIWLAAHGKTRADLIGYDQEILPFREMYDTQIPVCEAYARYMCWLQDETNKERCEK